MLKMLKNLPCTSVLVICINFVIKQLLCNIFGQVSGERLQDQWSSGLLCNCEYNSSWNQYIHLSNGVSASKTMIRVILSMHQNGRMVYFDDLIKDLWYIAEFSIIGCHGNQNLFFLIFWLLEDVKNWKSVKFTVLYRFNGMSFLKFESLVHSCPHLFDKFWWKGCIYLN